MSAYTDADVQSAQEAIGNFFGPDGNFDHYAAREAVAAVAPIIAARALREAAVAYHAARTANPSSVQYLQPETFLLDRAAGIEADQ